MYIHTYVGFKKKNIRTYMHTRKRHRHGDGLGPTNELIIYQWPNLKPKLSKMPN